MRLPIITVLFLLACPLSRGTGEEPVARRIIAFWDSTYSSGADDSIVHKNFEMPLNYLGLEVVYYEIQHDPLPVLTDDDRGILIAFDEGTIVPQPEKFIEWAAGAIKSGKKVVILKNPGFIEKPDGDLVSTTKVNELFERLGFRTSLEVVEYPIDYKIVSQSKELTNFERPYPTNLPPFTLNTADTRIGTSYLTVGDGKERSDLIILSEHGGYVDKNYANNFLDVDLDKQPYGVSRTIGWFINPFLFFSKAFNLAKLPKPDTTTLAGRRIFHSHVDGDGWPFLSEIEKYKKNRATCAETVLKEVILPNPDVPIAVGIIAAEVDPKWVGDKKSQQLARTYYSQPNVEPATHTYSHPFSWEFFKKDADKKEIYFLHSYPYGTWQSTYISWFRSQYYQFLYPKEFEKLKQEAGYVIPRAYANHRFNLKKEIVGAVDYLNQFASGEKKVDLLLWSGDSLVWEEGLEMAYQNEIANFNGGFTIFDSTFPSYLFVFPLARRLGGWIQTYASGNSEVPYTKDWSRDFYGYKFFIETLKNTGSPLRIKPLSLYFHMYSGQFQESLDAVLTVLNYIRTEQYVALKIKEFCSISEGFFSTKIDQINPNRWRIRDRKGLQTFRFDQKGIVVDIARSIGVIGYVEDLGSVYVYLDAAVKEPIIQLGALGSKQQPYLVDSSWQVWNFQQTNTGFQFHTKGFGPLEMQWKAPGSGVYTVEVFSETNESKKFQVSEEGSLLRFVADLPFDSEYQVKFSHKGG